jgi:hypothetical protein
MAQRTHPLTSIVLGSLLLAGCSSGGDPLTISSGSDVRLVSVQPASGAVGVDPTASLVMRFSAPMMAGMDQLVMIHEDSAGGPAVPISLQWSAERTMLTLQPSSPLQPASGYVLHLAPGMMDAAGHMLDLSPGAMMGGVWTSGNMMARQSMMSGDRVDGMMGTGWRPGDTRPGMVFTFTTG